MRVTIEHREQSAGIIGADRNYYVDCTVRFSEEEKAIIQARGLHGHVIIIEPPTPPPTQSQYMTAGALQAFSPFAGVIGAGLIFLSIFTRSDYGPLGGLLMVGAPFMWAFGFMMDRRIDYRFKHPKQHVAVRSLLNGNTFTVHSPDPAYSDILDDQIREQLARLKYTIMGSAEIKQKQSFEL